MTRFSLAEVLVLAEAAKTVSDASQAGLALYVNVAKGDIVLYDPARAREALGSGKNLDDLAAVLAYLGFDQHSDPHLGTVREVTASAARGKYGPLLYDYVLAGAWCMCDRSSVSPSAERVWTHYLERRQDVKRARVPREFRREGELTQREEAVLNSVFQLPAAAAAGYGPLLAAHDEFQSECEKGGLVTPARLKTALRLGATAFFTVMYTN